MNITEWSFNAQYVNVWSADLEALNTRCQKRESYSQIYRKPNQLHIEELLEHMKLNNTISTNKNIFAINK